MRSTPDFDYDYVDRNPSNPYPFYGIEDEEEDKVYWYDADGNADNSNYYPDIFSEYVEKVERD